MNQQRIGGDFDTRRPVIQFIAIDKHFNQRSAFEVTLNQSFRERVFDVLLQGAAQRAGAVRAIGAGLFHDPALCFLRQPHFQAVPRHGLVYLVDLELNDFEQFFIAQFIENNDLVKPIDKLRD